MIAGLAWPLVTLAVLLAAIAVVAGPVRRAITRWGQSWTDGDAAQQANLLERQLKVDKGHLELEVDRATQAELIAVRQAALTVEAEAVRQAQPEATEARRKIIAAQAQAQADLAPEAARQALTGTRSEVIAMLGGAYKDYCEALGVHAWSLKSWLDDFDLNRLLGPAPSHFRQGEAEEDPVDEDPQDSEEEGERDGDVHISD